MASVSDGMVKGISSGTATITATTENGLTASCRVTVVQNPESVTIPGTAELHLNGSEKQATATDLPAIVLPENASDKTITWVSDDESIVTVDDGVITAVKAGTATVCATTTNGLSAECQVTVIQHATGITMDKDEMELAYGATGTVSASVFPDDTTDAGISWSSGDERIATVSDGIVTAVSAGTTTITATTENGLSAAIQVTVLPKEITAKKTSVLVHGSLPAILHYNIPEDGVYQIFTTGVYDTVGIVYDADMNVIAEDDDSGTGSINFLIEYGFHKDDSIYISLGLWENTADTMVTLQIVRVGDLPEEETESDITWKDGSIATASWKPVENADYYQVQVYVYADGTLLGTQTTGTADTELDVQQEIHQIVTDESTVQVSFTVTPATSNEDGSFTYGTTSEMS